MARGIIKHLKRMYAPKQWMLDKLRGRWAPKPNAGPHKLRECLPLIVMLRQRLKYALTYREVKMIVMQRLIKVDGKVRSDMFYPAGFMDVVQIEKTKENFRLLYNTKGRFMLHKVAKEEANYKLCRVKKVMRGPRGIPYAVTHDGRTVRYPDPDVKAHDTVRLNLETGKILDHVKFETGNLVMISGGNNIGRDAMGHTFNTRLENVFVIGDGQKPWISLPKGQGIKLSIIEDRELKAWEKFLQETLQDPLICLAVVCIMLMPLGAFRDMLKEMGGSILMVVALLPPGACHHWLSRAQPGSPCCGMPLPNRVGANYEEEEDLLRGRWRPKKGQTSHDIDEEFPFGIKLNTKTTAMLAVGVCFLFVVLVKVVMFPSPSEMPLPPRAAAAGASSSDAASFGGLQMATKEQPGEGEKPYSNQREQENDDNLAQRSKDADDQDQLGNEDQDQQGKQHFEDEDDQKEKDDDDEEL
ncbi:unnamed protein product [Cladocopium goreaui]|uniref:Small ribosomal subunit protein eS4 (40S ribosomal protein S4) n=1 Tax=Cladocopium goreaui TaxID=2562237 RepID=A0A9P1GLP8_9DINO|nr:unnamed protein product [Cladocopium goreaui]